MNKSVQVTLCTYNDEPLRALSSTRRTRGTANARSEIVIMYQLLSSGEHKVQGVVLILESININLAQLGVPLT